MEIKVDPTLELDEASAQALSEPEVSPVPTELVRLTPYRSPDEEVAEAEEALPTWLLILLSLAETLARAWTRSFVALGEFFAQVGEELNHGLRRADLLEACLLFMGSMMLAGLTLVCGLLAVLPWVMSKLLWLLFWLLWGVWQVLRGLAWGLFWLARGLLWLILQLLRGLRWLLRAGWRGSAQLVQVVARRGNR